MKKETSKYLGIGVALIISIWIAVLFLDKQGKIAYQGIEQPTFPNEQKTRVSHTGTVEKNEILSPIEKETGGLEPLTPDVQETAGTQVQTSLVQKKNEVQEPSAILVDILTEEKETYPTSSLEQKIQEYKNKSHISPNNTETKTTQNDSHSYDAQEQEETEKIQTSPTHKDQQDKHTLIIKNISVSNPTKAESKEPTAPTSVSHISEVSHHLATKQKNDQVLRKQHIIALEKIYKEKQKHSDLKQLIQELVKNYEFESAWAYLEPIGIEQDHDIDPMLYLYTYFNTLDLDDQKACDTFQEKLARLYEKKRITQQDYDFYSGILMLKDGDYTKAQEIWKTITQEQYLHTITAIKKIQEKIATQRDIPLYYQDALVALEMLKAGYFSLAKHIAFGVIEQDTKYILPYQILAYSDFLTNNLHACISYFQTLTKKDPAKHNSYIYMMAVSYYWVGEYTNAILHFNQLKQYKALRTDVLRYLILGYKKLDDKKRMLEIYEELIAEKALLSQDFVNFFTDVFVLPYEKYGKIRLLPSVEQLAERYIQRCAVQSDPEVCLLGKIGQSAMYEKWNKTTLTMLNQLLPRYQQNFTLQLLGDYYYHIAKYDKAKAYYLKAILTTISKKEKAVIKEKLILTEQASAEGL